MNGIKLFATPTEIVKLDVLVGHKNEGFHENAHIYCISLWFLFLFFFFYFYMLNTNNKKALILLPC